MNPVLGARMQKQAKDAVHTRIHIHGDQTTFQRIQDCTPIAEHAKALHNEGYHGGSEFRHAAKIPMVIIEKYCNDNGIEFREFMASPEHGRRLLNAPENDAFRIWKGRI